jgi:hypothetical protein
MGTGLGARRELSKARLGRVLERVSHHGLDMQVHPITDSLLVP